MELQTERLSLRPMSDAEIEALMERTPSEELRSAYGEMLSGGKSGPENRVWYAPWCMALKDGADYIGDLCFKGPVKDHSVEIGYGIQPEYEGKGYATEVVQAMTQWAFGQKDVVASFQQTFSVKSRTVLSDSVLANTNNSYLGCVVDPETRAKTTCNFMAQFNVLENTIYPERKKMLTDAEGKLIIDSCAIRIFINDYYGDSLQTMKLAVQELDTAKVIKVILVLA